MGGTMEFVLLGIVFLIGTWMAGFWGGSRASNKELAVRLEALEQKHALLEQRCEKLQDQVTEAHLQLADERRVLDQKLSAMLPPPESTVSETEKAKPQVRVQA
jgi:uncharacterized coiled-coil protein SlyX